MCDPILDDVQQLRRIRSEVAAQLSTLDAVLARVESHVPLLQAHVSKFEAALAAGLKRLGVLHHFQWARDGGQFQPPGTPYRVDFYCPARRLIIEAMGIGAHGHPNNAHPERPNAFNRETLGETYARDIERLTRLHTLGYTVGVVWMSSTAANRARMQSDLRSCLYQWLPGGRDLHTLLALDFDAPKRPRARSLRDWYAAARGRLGGDPVAAERVYADYAAGVDAPLDARRFWARLRELVTVGKLGSRLVVLPELRSSKRARITPLA